VRRKREVPRALGLRRKEPSRARGLCALAPAAMQKPRLGRGWGPYGRHRAHPAAPGVR